jgi:hypothetical protein
LDAIEALLSDLSKPIDNLLRLKQSQQHSLSSATRSLLSSSLPVFFQTKHQMPPLLPITISLPNLSLGSASSQSNKNETGPVSKSLSAVVRTENKTNESSDFQSETQTQNQNQRMNEGQMVHPLEIQIKSVLIESLSKIKLDDKDDSLKRSDQFQDKRDDDDEDGDGGGDDEVHQNEQIKTESENQNVQTPNIFTSLPLSLNDTGID